MRDIAVEVLARHGVPQRLVEQQACGQQLAALEAELAAVEARIPWWERAAFFRASPEEVRASDLGARRDAAQEALVAATAASERAVAAASAELPVLALATRVERVVARAVADRAIGLCGGGDAVLAIELESIADAIATTWVPDLDPAAVLAALADDRVREAAAATASGAPRPDPRLGWAPIQSGELVSRSAASLATGSFGSLRASLHREAGEHAALASRLRELRKSAGTLAVMTGQNLEAHHAAIAIEAQLPREHAELVLAFESFDHALLEALAAFPPMRLALACQRAAGVLHARLHAVEMSLDASGAACRTPSPRFRALFLAALVDLRRVLDATLPGLGALVAARGGARDVEDLARAVQAQTAPDAGPYRRAGVAENDAPPPPPPTQAALEAQLAVTFDRLGLPARRDRGLAHAVMLASLSRWRRAASTRVGLVDRLAFWSESEEQGALAALEARERWHRGLAHAIVEDAVGCVRAGSQGVFVIALRDALLRAHVAVDSLGTVTGSSGSTMSCPVYFHGDAVTAIEHLRGIVGGGWGMHGGQGELAAAVFDHLRSTPRSPSPAAALREPRPLSWAAVVASVGEGLRDGGWVELHLSVQQTWGAYQRATGAVSSAEASITWFDKLNFFTSTPAEEEKKQRSAEANALHGTLRAQMAQHAAMLNGALAVYPPGAAYLALEGVAARIAEVRAVLRRRTHTRRVGNTQSTYTTYHCELLGKPEAVGALRGWTRAARSVFGHLPGDGEILERTWSHALRHGA